MTISEQLRELLADVRAFPIRGSAALSDFMLDRAPHFVALEEENVRLRESLSWALSKVSQPRLVVGQNEEHCAAYQSARAALQEQPK